jgi:hypothetical protein
VLDGSRRLARSLARRVDDYRRVGRSGVSAWLHDRAGRPERALLERAQLIRHVKVARESMRSYRQVERLVDRHPSQLASYAVDGQRPECFVLFVGYPRSGHSLVGSLLDAHPEIVIAHELDALRHLLRGHSFDETVRALRLNSIVFHSLGRSYTGYDYVVPGQFQGRTSRLRVVGDKKGNGTVRLLRRDPEALDRLRDRVPVPMRYVHVVRNPFDNIATKARRQGTSLRYASSSYFANVEVVARLREREGESVLDVHLDDLLGDPAAQLARLVGFLGLSTPDEGYLAACASILFEKPRRSALEADWDAALVREIERRAGEVDFLRRFVA